MQNLDFTIRHGTVVTAVDTFQCDIGITGGRVVAMLEHLPAGGRDIDASRRLVLPGGGG